jgi:hypothetical protein
MKAVFMFLSFLILTASGCTTSSGQEMGNGQQQPAMPNKPSQEGKHLFMDVHHLEPGKVTFEAVAEAHLKDLATQEKYDVSFIKFWVDEAAGKVYCLAEAPNGEAIYRTHTEAHGLAPDEVHLVKEGE